MTRNQKLSVRSTCQLGAMALGAVLVAACAGGGGGSGGEGGGRNGVGVGTFFACALRSGGVWCWGLNDSGQLGDGTTENRGRAAPVQGLSSGVGAIAVGRSHACALLRDKVMCWGSNGNRELGTPEEDNCVAGELNRAPLRVAGLPAGVQALAAGGSHTCALVNGGVRCWGNNSRGQLGSDNDLVGCWPVAIPGLESGVTAISAGSKHTCVVVNGGVKCWGGDQYGQLGDGNYGSTTFFRSTPYTVIPEGSGATAVAVTERNSCSIVGQALKCWGAPSGGPVFATTCNPHCTPTTVMEVPAGTTSLSVADGNVYLLASGGAKVAGRDELGELGDGEPRTPSAALVDVAGLTTGVEALGASVQSACALLEDGEVRCWGMNHKGQLGDETTTDRSAPVTVHGL